ncbi:Fic family protein [Enterovirga aerilata]|uniref:Fic family protein n=1 Tax=Enterovirga aerilata TaxID=2730920 RepID=A0A849IEC6_9HYPH|nr:Fic family protein [Enterovirga sp. DB1703]NNM74575.1 Fic family protein [Enterovirga sp. DB1703]
MKKADFEGSPSGRLVPTERGQWAFVPNDLPPPALDLGSLATPLGEAYQALGELNGMGRILGDPYLLIRPLQNREALASSSMEGTYTTIDDLLLADAGSGEAGQTSDTREVLNYRIALAQALESMESLPLSLRTLRDAHRVLLRSVARHRGSRALPGELKQHQNFIGAFTIEDARFVPPPPADALRCLDALERFIHREDRLGIPDLVDAACIHYQFETIHPFADGNGRVGRMLILLHLVMRGVIRQPTLYLSPVLETRKDEYIDLMFEVSRRGAWLPWIRFFLEVVKVAANEAVSTAEALLALQTDYRIRLQRAGRSANLLAIVDLLFKRPVVTIPQIAEHLGVTYRSAQLNTETLVAAGILSERPGTSNPRFFAARDVLTIISGSH